MEFHDRLLERAIAMGVRNARIVHRGTRRPRLVGAVDGISIVLGLPQRPRDLPCNFFNAIRDLRCVVNDIRRSHNSKGGSYVEQEQ